MYVAEFKVALNLAAADPLYLRTARQKYDAMSAAKPLHVGSRPRLIPDNAAAGSFAFISMAGREELWTVELFAVSELN